LAALFLLGSPLVLPTEQSTALFGLRGTLVSFVPANNALVVAGNGQESGASHNISKTTHFRFSYGAIDENLR
jgi:hypothetical protein